MELIGAIILCYGIVILWDYNSALLCAMAGLAVIVGMACFFESRNSEAARKSAAEPASLPRHSPSVTIDEIS
jgi:hypothetical protein